MEVCAACSSTIESEFRRRPRGQARAQDGAVLNMLGSYTPNADSDLVLLAHERSELFKSITVFYRGCLTAAPGIE